VVEQVFLLLARFAELVEALLYDHMTGCARAVATACVFEMDAVPQHQIEDRAGLAVMMKRRLGGVEFDHLFGVTVFELDSQFRHRASVESQIIRRGDRNEIDNYLLRLPSLVETTVACIFA